MTITQTIDVPADHRVFFEFLAPREIPAGKAKVEVKVTPVVEKPTDQRSPDQRSETASKSANEGASPHPNSDAIFGILSGMGNITLEQIRDERLAKHTKHLKNFK